MEQYEKCAIVSKTFSGMDNQGINGMQEIEDRVLTKMKERGKKIVIT